MATGEEEEATLIADVVSGTTGMVNHKGMDGVVEGVTAEEVMRTTDLVHQGVEEMMANEGITGGENQQGVHQEREDMIGILGILLKGQRVVATDGSSLQTTFQICFLKHQL